MRDDVHESQALGERLPAAELARRIGRLEAEVVDLRLALTEADAREQRLLELLGRGGQSSGERDAEMRRLEEQLDQQSRMLRAIEDSKGWRAIQLLRRIVGRAW